MATLEKDTSDIYAQYKIEVDPAEAHVTTIRLLWIAKDLLTRADACDLTDFQ